MQPIHIAFCTDANYLMPCGVAMISVCENHAEHSVIFHIVLTGEQGEEEAVMRPLSDIAARYGQSLRVYHISKRELDGFECKGASYVSTTGFARIFLSKLLPADVHRVLYLDCDVAVNAPLMELWDTPLEADCPLGAVVDVHGYSPVRRKATGLSISIPYFNSGVLLMNLDCWRRENLSEKAVALALEKGSTLPMLDQDVLNVLLQNRIKPLPVTYNLQTFFLFVPELYWMTDVASAEAVKAAIPHPAIVHYVSINKPWCDALCPLREIWDRYFQQSIWKDIPLSEVITRFDRTSVYNSFIASYWSDTMLFKESLPPFVACMNAAVRLKNKRLFMYIATRPLSWMAWLLNAVYDLKARHARGRR